MDWLNAVILFVLFAGHCELMAAWINRVHALPLRRSFLKATRGLHDVLVLGFLPVVVWRVGFSGPNLLSGGEWLALPGPWCAYFACCGLGVASLAWSSGVWLTRTRPEVRASRLVNVANELGHSPSGPGLRGRIARVRGNEVFLLEIDTKELLIDRLPSELDGLSIAHLSDTHFRGPVGLDYFRYAFDRITEMEADFAVFTGDLLDEPELARWLPETFGKVTAPLGCWFILGNHDAFLELEPVRRMMADLGWRDLAGQTAIVEHRDRRILLGGDETPWMGHPPKRTDRDAVDLSILLSHSPDNFHRAAGDGVDLVLSGHNHGGQVCLPLLGPIYSPSRFGIRYAAGTFRRHSTTLHVSRGMSAERPLRWNCPPEVTKLVLRAGQAPARRRS